FWTSSSPKRGRAQSGGRGTGVRPVGPAVAVVVGVIAFSAAGRVPAVFSIVARARGGIPRSRDAGRRGTRLYFASPLAYDSSRRARPRPPMERRRPAA